MSYTCNVCLKTFKTSRSLASHRHKYHRSQAKLKNGCRYCAQTSSINDRLMEELECWVKLSSHDLYERVCKLIAENSEE